MNANHSFDTLDAQSFAAKCKQTTEKTWIPMWRRLMGDTLTPVLAYRRLVRPDNRLGASFLFESVEGGADASSAGRFSYMGARPCLEIKAFKQHMSLQDIGGVLEGSRDWNSEDPMQDMQRLTEQLHVTQPSASDQMPPFIGGWVGYASYDTVRYQEPDALGEGPLDDRNMPDLHMQLYLDMIAFDHVQKSVLLITHVEVDRATSAKIAWQKGCEQLDEMAALIGRPLHQTNQEELPLGHITLAGEFPKLPTSNMGAGGYQEAVLKAKEYIKAGDCFQVVPSQRFTLKTTVDPFDVYRALRMVNPSPYMVYLQAGGGMLVASSPEILCRVRDGKIVNRPLAGTRHRGKTYAEDLALEQDLLNDPKDTSEHVMLVDLGRNDVGRMAKPGTVQIEKLMCVERYSHVMHLSSTVTGELRDGNSAWDALRMSLPVGTVSGAPKVRSMQIIDDLEPTRRGPYAGAVGFANLHGDMDMAIALRTMVILPDVNGWRVDIQAGAGIVADSDPDAEHQETLNKSAAMARAVELAEQNFLPSQNPQDPS